MKLKISILQKIADRMLDLAEYLLFEAYFFFFSLLFLERRFIVLYLVFAKQNFASLSYFYRYKQNFNLVYTKARL